MSHNVENSILPEGFGTGVMVDDDRDDGTVEITITGILGDNGKSYQLQSVFSSSEYMKYHGGLKRVVANMKKAWDSKGLGTGDDGMDVIAVSPDQSPTPPAAMRGQWIHAGKLKSWITSQALNGGDITIDDIIEHITDNAVDVVTYATPEPGAEALVGAEEASAQRCANENFRGYERTCESQGDFHNRFLYLVEEKIRAERRRLAAADSGSTGEGLNLRLQEGEG